MQLALQWEEKRMNSFIKINVKLYGFILLCTVGCTFAGWLLGIPVLSLVYGVDLTGYRM